MTAASSQLERRIVDLPNGDRRYCVLGPSGGVDFHVSGLGRHDPIAGLEMHYRQPPSYMRDRAADFDKCWLTGAPCWCDGTSLYATEWLPPLFGRGTPEDVERFWPVLEHEYRQRMCDAFGDEPEVSR